jgi:shikimate dehydrogenase
MGTGGAARAIVVALAEAGFVLVLAGRNPAKAQALLDELARGNDHHAVDIAHFADPTDFAFDDRADCLDLVNASLLGMAGQPPCAMTSPHAARRGVLRHCHHRSKRRCWRRRRLPASRPSMAWRC